MKRKLMLVTVVLSMVLAGCSNSTETGSTNSELETKEASTEMQTPPPDAEIISGTVEVPINDKVATEDTTKSEETEISEDSNVKYYKSTLTGLEAYANIPDGYTVSYSDDYSIEMVKEFSQDVEFDFIDEDNDTTFYDEIISTNFTDICNTPYVDSINYTKAQLVNFGYRDIYDLTVGGRDFIVGCSDINREEVNETEEPFWKCYPKTSICILTVTNDNCECLQEEDCFHTEFIEISCFTHDELNGDEVLSYATGVIEKCMFNIVKG